MPVTDTTDWHEAVRFLADRTVRDVTAIDAPPSGDGAAARLLFERDDSRWMLVDSLADSGHVQLAVTGPPTADGETRGIAGRRVVDAHVAAGERGEPYGLWLTLDNATTIAVHGGFDGAQLSFGEPDDRLPEPAPVRLALRSGGWAPFATELPPGPAGDPHADAVAAMDGRARAGLGWAATVAARYMAATADDLLDLIDGRDDDALSDALARLAGALRTLEIAGVDRPCVASLPLGVLADAHLAAAPADLDVGFWPEVRPPAPTRSIAAEDIERLLDDTRIAAFVAGERTATLTLTDGRVVTFDGGRRLRVRWSANTSRASLEDIDDPRALSVAMAGRALHWAQGPDARYGTDLELTVGSQAVSFAGDPLTVTIADHAAPAAGEDT